MWNKACKKIMENNYVIMIKSKYINQVSDEMNWLKYNGKLGFYFIYQIGNCYVTYRI